MKLKRNLTLSMSRNVLVTGSFITIFGLCLISTSAGVANGQQPQNGGRAPANLNPVAKQQIPTTGEVIPQTKPTPGSTGFGSTISNPIQQQQVIDEINSIRQQMGGGVGATLQGIVSNDQGPGSEDARNQLQADFNAELERLNRINTQDRFNTPAGVPMTSADSTAKFRYQNSVASNGKSPNANEVKTLREAARGLEQAAALLEDVGRYADADQIREKAVQLWLSARQARVSGVPTNLNPK